MGFRLGGAAALLFAALVWCWPSTAGAVPAFARRYGTSCQTCHVVVPELTPFGEAFRRNGYRFPGGLDEDYRREEPQPLGAEAYADLFPKAVWPGETPRTVPLSLLTTATANAVPSADAVNDRFGMGGSIGLNGATPIGEWLSVWAGAALRASTSDDVEVELERVFFVIAPLKNPSLRFRLGRFEPSLFGFSSHRTLGYMPQALGRTVGDNEFSFEPAQVGAEADGVVARGRVAYAVGYVEGSGNELGFPGDAYARLGVKVGGMRLDGETDDDEPDVANPAPWREWSAQFDAFGYVGFPTIGDAGVATQTDRFVAVGGDAIARLRDASLMLAYTYRRNERPFLIDPARLTNTHDAMLQLEYVVLPWFVPLVRYEYASPAEVPNHRIAPGTYFLIRANVRAMLLGRVDLGSDGAVDASRLDLGFFVGF